MAIENLWFRYVFTKTSTCFIKTEQRVKINDVYSSWIEIVFDVTQSSILGPLLFIIFLCELFWLFLVMILLIIQTRRQHCLFNWGKFADILLDLGKKIDILLKWFCKNYLKRNPENIIFYLALIMSYL